MILGSHNSLSYLRPKRWWMRAFAFMARCQRVNLAQQYATGVRLFDLRVWFDKTGDIQVRHGRMLYDFNIDKVHNILYFLDKMGGCFCRVILEEDNILKRAKHAPMAETVFSEFCKRISSMYTHVKFFGGNRKYDWKVLYDFGRTISLDDKYSSTTSLFKSPKRWLAVLDDLCPWLYARLHNQENIRNGTDKDCLFIDFVDVGQ